LVSSGERGVPPQKDEKAWWGPQKIKIFQGFWLKPNALVADLFLSLHADDSVPLDEEGWYPNPRPLGLVDTLPTWLLVSSAEAKARSTIILRPSTRESHAARGYRAVLHLFFA
jgi:hypothetical protein